MNILNNARRHQTLAELFELHLSCNTEEKQLLQTIKSNESALALLKLKIREAPQPMSPQLLDQLQALSVTQAESHVYRQSLIQKDNEIVGELADRLGRFRGKQVRLKIKNISYIVTKNDRSLGIRWCYDTGVSSIHNFKIMNVSTGNKKG